MPSTRTLGERGRYVDGELAFEEYVRLRNSHHWNGKSVGTDSS